MALRALRRAKQRPARQLRITGLPVASLGLEDLGALQSAALSCDLHELTLAGRPGRRPQRTGALTSVLQSLADTQHEALATLDLSWTDAVGSEELAAALAHAPSLTALSLCGCSRIDGAFVHEHVLPLAPQLRVLGLSCCELLDGTAVAPVVRHCPAIEVLELSGVRIGVRAFMEILGAARRSLRRLALADHTRLGSPSFAQALRACPRLTDIDFSSSLCDDTALVVGLGLSGVDVPEDAQLGPPPPPLQVPLFAQPPQAPPQAQGQPPPEQPPPPQAPPPQAPPQQGQLLQLLQAQQAAAQAPQPQQPPPPPAAAGGSVHVSERGDGVVTRCVLRHVALRDCRGVEEAGVEAVLKSAQGQLQSLQLGGVFSPARDACARLLADPAHHASLTDLALPCCVLSVDGAAALGPLLVRLTRLDLAHSGSGEAALEKLLPRHGVGCGANLRHLVLRGCSGATDQVLAGYWPRATQLLSLDVSQCRHLSDATAVVLASSWSGRAASRRPSLRRLDVSACVRIGDGGRAALRRLAATAPALCVLGLDEADAVPKGDAYTQEGLLPRHLGPQAR